MRLPCIKYFNSEKPKWLYAAAFVFACGFLNKYNIVFAVLGLLPAILLSPQRKVFSKKELYFALLLALFLISPNLIWQFQNDFPVIHHMHQLAELQLVNVNRVDFLRAQFFFFISSIFVLLSGLLSLLLYPPFKTYRFFFSSLIFTLSIFLYLKAKDYYAIGLYPIYLSFGSVYLAHMLNTGPKKYLLYTFMALPLLFFIPMTKILYPNKSPEYIKEHHEAYQKYGLLHWEDGKDHDLPQDYADMLGWKELARKVDSVYKDMPDHKQTLVLCDNYGQAGALNFYSKTGIKAVTFNADYINWFDLNTKYLHLIRVKNASERDEEFAKTSPYFEKAALADSITNPNAREHGTLIFSFINAKIDINKRIEKEIEEVKSQQN